MTHFDKSVKWYDWLSQLVFGSRLRDIERKLISHLPHSGTILWIGGGSGQILPEIMEARPDLRIVYLDTSENMVRIAKERMPASTDRVAFLTSETQFQDHMEEINAVLLFFVLDLFNEEELAEMLPAWIFRQGKWVEFLLVADFHYPATPLGKMIASVLIPSMYFFFRLSIHLPTTRLPDWKKSLEDLGYVEASVNQGLMGVVRSGLWRLL